MDRQTVYVVTSGEYSDYGIRAMFSTEEAAARYVEEYNRSNKWDSAGVEEWALDEESEKRSITVWQVWIDLEDGTIFETDTETKLIDPNGECEVTPPIAHHYARRGKTVIRVSSPVSQEHAIKVATEKRQEWLRSRA